MNNTKKLSEIFEFTENELNICKRCRKEFPAVGYVEGFGYPKFQPPFCQSCAIIIDKEDEERELKEKQFERNKYLREIAIDCGAPPDKVKKVQRKDIGMIITEQEGETKQITFEELIKIFIQFKAIYIKGESGSGKSHFATIIFMEMLRQFPMVDYKKFKWTTLTNIHSEIQADINREWQILTELINQKVLAFTFGEYRGELITQSESMSMKARNILFQLFENRLENLHTYNMYTILITTWKQAEMLQYLDFPFLRRILEMCIVVDMGKNKGYSEKIFKDKPKFKVD